MSLVEVVWWCYWYWGSTILVFECLVWCYPSTFLSFPFFNFIVAFHHLVSCFYFITFNFELILFLFVSFQKYNLYLLPLNLAIATTRMGLAEFWIFQVSDPDHILGYFKVRTSFKWIRPAQCSSLLWYVFIFLCAVAVALFEIRVAWHWLGAMHNALDSFEWLDRLSQ